MMYPIVIQEKLGKVGTHQAKESEPQPQINQGYMMLQIILHAW